NATSPTDTYTLSLHDALPICWRYLDLGSLRAQADDYAAQLSRGLLQCQGTSTATGLPVLVRLDWRTIRPVGADELHSEWLWKPRSEEHTSELQSLTNLVCRLL